MFEPKPLSREAIPAALEKAERYRLLNEPMEAESICRDVLAVEAENHGALIALLLALTDQFDQRLHEVHRQAKELLAHLHDPYEAAYYGGILHERRGKSLHKRGGVGCGYVAYDCLRQAMELYEQAAELRPHGNDDAILRWNACARLINRSSDLRPEPHHAVEHMLE